MTAARARLGLGAALPAAADHGPSGRLLWPPLERLALAAIALCLGFQVHLVFAQEINWDEFYFLSLVHDYQRGTLAKALQTLHVHLFGWLAGVGRDEIAQIEAARLVMLLCEAGTIALSYGLARRFVSRTGACVAALAYVSAGYVLLHGASFRADPIAAFLMMASLYLLSRPGLRTAGLTGAGAAAAIAMLVTVKSVLYAPALLAVAAWRIAEAPRKGAAAARLAIAFVAACGLAALLYWMQLSLLPRSDVAGSGDMMSSAWRTTLVVPGLLPRLDYMLQGILLAPAQSFLLASGAIAAALAVWRRADTSAKPLLLLLLAAPLASFLVYRNAFPYFFAFIFPPAMPLVGYAVDRMRGRRFLLVALVVAMAGNAAVQYGRAAARDRAPQERLVAAVHALFPEPVAYIDRCSMIAGFPKQGFFMSSWGLADYRRQGRPVFAAILAEAAPPLLIANSPPLVGALRGTGPAGQGLLEEDEATLRAHYIHHWGAIWVAGKRLDLGPGGTRFDIAIPGVYTVEAEGPIEIDGERRAPGSVVRLARGRHAARAPAPLPVVLRWGEHLPVPHGQPDVGPVFAGF